MDYLKLASIYCDRNLSIDEATFTLGQDGIVYISYWNITDKPQPTIEQLESFQPVLDKREQDSKLITRRQLLFWLFVKKNIKEEAIFTAINTIPNEDTKYLAEKSYTGTSNFEYGNPFVQIIGSALGLTEQELIQCFDEAGNM